MAHVIWLTGISGSGKTTLASELKIKFLAKKAPVQVLDGDEVRRFFDHDLGYTWEARIANVKRVAFGAYLLSKHNINVIVANIAPYQEVRDFIRRKLGSAYIQIYVKADLELVSKRDVQGHYARAKTQEKANLIGLDDRYDIPRNPDVICDSGKETVKESVEKIVRALRGKGLEL